MPPDNSLQSPFGDEQTCISYLFNKRWPWGFKCPQCGGSQKEVSPAVTITCKYCKKKTSITAHTLIHGSKKNLVNWVRVAFQFCQKSGGISARELQKILAISNYQTAWNLLNKIRKAASLAESKTCQGVVLFDVVEPGKLGACETQSPSIGIALELQKRRQEESRMRMFVLTGRSCQEIANAVQSLVNKRSTLLLTARECALIDRLQENYLVGHPCAEHIFMENELLQEVNSWLLKIYRGTIDIRFLQSYLDEFCFRHNTASWSDRQAVLDHLLTALITPLPDSAANQSNQVENTGGGQS